MSYIGNQPVPQSLESRQEFTATASQTTFATNGYTVGYVDVYLNGVKLSTSDFTATNGSDVVLGSGATAGDVLAVVMKNDHSDLVALPITDSQGNNVLSESSGTVTLTADTAIIEGSSSGDLVRITQTGTGNALVVEDETNPDSTAFVINNVGKVGIRKSVPTAELDVVGLAAFNQKILVNGHYIDSQTVSSGDADDYKSSGFYRMDSGVSNLPTAYIYAVVVFGNGSNVVTQIATRLATTITYVRSFNTSWTSWARLDT